MSESFSRMNEAKVDRNHRAYWMTITSNRWLSVRLEFAGSCATFDLFGCFFFFFSFACLAGMLTNPPPLPQNTSAGNSLVFATALLIVLTKGKLDPGFSGLALAYALSISGTLNWVRQRCCTHFFFFFFFPPCRCAPLTCSPPPFHARAAL